MRKILSKVKKGFSTLWEVLKKIWRMFLIMFFLSLAVFVALAGYNYDVVLFSLTHADRVRETKILYNTIHKTADDGANTRISNILITPIANSKTK